MASMSASPIVMSAARPNSSALAGGKRPPPPRKPKVPPRHLGGGVQRLWGRWTWNWEGKLWYWEQSGPSQGKWVCGTEVWADEKAPEDHYLWWHRSEPHTLQKNRGEEEPDPPPTCWFCQATLAPPKGTSPGHLSSRNTEISPRRPCVHCAAIHIARLAFIRLTFVPRGTAEWLGGVDRDCRLAILPSKVTRHFTKTIS